MTSILTDCTYTFLENNNLLPTEQKGCRLGSYGCKDQLLMNKMVLEHCNSNTKNLSVAWIDYKKAFDSIPHDWIIKAMEMYRVAPEIINFVKIRIKTLKTILILNHGNGSITSNNISINRGIFQGDSFFRLSFCIALFPLSKLLNESNRRYNIFDQVISHLFYMDNLKLFAKNSSDLKDLLTIVKDFSDDIGMEFGIGKCAKASFKRSKFCKASNINLETNTKIRNLEHDEVYKYLGINEGDGIKHTAMKEEICKECYRRVRLILQSELNSSNRVKAINSIAVPVVTYSFGIINWSETDVARIDAKIRKLLTKFRIYLPKSDVDRLYLPRTDGGLGLNKPEMRLR